MPRVTAQDERSEYNMSNGFLPLCPFMFIIITFKIVYPVGRLKTLYTLAILKSKTADDHYSFFMCSLRLAFLDTYSSLAILNRLHSVASSVTPS